MKKILLVLIFFVTACSQDINYVENCADKKWLDGRQNVFNFVMQQSKDKSERERHKKYHNNHTHSFNTFSLNEKLNTNNNNWYAPHYEIAYEKCQNEYRKNKSLFEAKHSS